MSTTAFILVLAGIGVVYLILFHRMRKRYEKRHPGEKNPLDYWFKGKDKED